MLGDLAEAALIQGIERGSVTSVSIGVAGGWNSTQARRHLMLQSRYNVQMTDPEIRGDVDGFALGSVIQSALNIYSGLKLSQVLDMYYSPLVRLLLLINKLIKPLSFIFRFEFFQNGVFQSDLRACNRRELSQQYTTESTLIAETQAFATALDSNLLLRGTIVGGLDQLVNSAVTNFQSYMSKLKNMIDCLSPRPVSVAK